MSDAQVLLVRVYLHERDKGLRAALRYLHDESGVRGVTMFRGVLGYGADHAVRSASFTDLSLDLPVVIEFFDAPDRAREIVEQLEAIVDPSHVVWWPAHTGPGDGPGTA